MATSFNLISPVIIELYLQNSIQQLLYLHVFIVLKIIQSHALGPGQCKCQFDHWNVADHIFNYARHTISLENIGNNFFHYGSKKYS